MDTPAVPLGTRGIKKRPPKVAHPEDFAENIPVPIVIPVKQKTPNEEFIDLLTSCTLKAFHESDVDIKCITNEVYVVLYFPEVTIRNSNNQKHVIKDTYIRLTFNLKEKYPLSDVGIRRGTYTYAEYQSTYIHSHVSGRFNIMLSDYENSICWGSTTIASLKTLLNSKFDSSNYVNFLWLLKNWMSWESLEGVPFRHLDKIKITQSTTYIDYRTEARTIVNSIFTERVLPDLKIQSDFLNKFNSFEIIQNISSSTYINLTDINNSTLEKIIKPFTNHVGLMKNGNFEIISQINISKSTIDSINKLSVPFKFKDKTITPKIDYTGIEDSQKPIDKSMLKVHPSLVDAVAYELDELLNKLIDEEF